MKVNIEKSTVHGSFVIIESASFFDRSDNLWRIDVGTSKIYINYLGKQKDRVEKFRIFSTDGMELLTSHGDVFSTDNQIENYYRIRDMLRGSTTLDIWKQLQMLIAYAEFVQ